MSNNELSPRIYVASLADYNAGRLCGAWIDLEGKSADEVREEIASMLAESKEPGAEEFAIHGFEGFGGVEIGEFDSIDSVVELASALAEHGEAYAAYVEIVGAHYATPDGFEESYAGTFSSVEDYVEETFREYHEIPEHLDAYIDWEKITRDWTLSGDISSVQGSDGVHVFRNF